MNVNEWGKAFLFSTGFDMSGFSGIAIDFTKPDGTTLNVSNPNVTVPNTDVSTTAGTFLANHYAKYVFANGDVNQKGIWSARVIYDDSTQHLISEPSQFVVNA